MTPSLTNFQIVVAEAAKIKGEERKLKRRRCHCYKAREN
jgi:hypothetical protein